MKHHSIIVSSLLLAASACAYETEEPAGTIEPAAIQAAMREQYAETLRACYETVLEESPEASGKLELSFVIRDGLAEDIVAVAAEGDLDEEGFTRCAEDGLLDVSFPRAVGGVDVTYPYELTNR